MGRQKDRRLGYRAAKATQQHNLFVANRYQRGQKFLIEESRKPQPLPSLPHGFAWFALRTTPQLRRDRRPSVDGGIGQHRLRLLADLDALGIPHFLPLYTRRISVKLNGGRLSTKRVTELPLLPGYLFVGLTALWAGGKQGLRPYDASAEDRAAVAGQEEVLGILANEKLAIPVPEALLSILAEKAQDGRFDSEGRAVPKASDFAAGETLNIVHGPFAGLPAAFERGAAGDRLRVLLQMFGGQRSVEVAIEDVQRGGRAA